MTKKIMTVDEVTASLGKSKPPTLTVDARGTVNTGGWTNPRLSPHIYIQPPADGIQGFDFVADEPEGMVTQALEPITTRYSERCDDWVKGVRVHAERNAIETNAIEAKV